MRFSTVFSVLACGAMAMAAIVSPNALVKRTNDQITAIISDMDSKCTDALIKIDTCVDAGCTKAVIADVAAIVDDEVKLLVGLVGAVDQVIAKAIAQVIIKIVIKVNTHKSTCGAACGDVTVYAALDASITALLKQLEVCLVGLLAIIGSFLEAIFTVLEGLAFKLVIALVKLT